MRFPSAKVLFFAFKGCSKCGNVLFFHFVLGEVELFLTENMKMHEGNSMMLCHKNIENTMSGSQYFTYEKFEVNPKYR